MMSFRLTLYRKMAENLSVCESNVESFDLVYCTIVEMNKQDGGISFKDFIQTIGRAKIMSILILKTFLRGCIRASKSLIVFR